MADVAFDRQLFALTLDDVAAVAASLEDVPTTADDAFAFTFYISELEDRLVAFNLAATLMDDNALLGRLDLAQAQLRAARARTQAAARPDDARRSVSPDRPRGRRLSRSPARRSSSSPGSRTSRSPLPSPVPSTRASSPSSQRLAPLLPTPVSPYMSRSSSRSSSGSSRDSSSTRDSRSMSRDRDTARAAARCVALQQCRVAASKYCQDHFMRLMLREYRGQ